MKQQTGKISSTRHRNDEGDGLAIPYELSPRQYRLGMLLFAILGIAAGMLYVLPMNSVVGVLGFPLDDSWIPLTFAKNLREFGSYSYFQREMITSGCTSPLYVFLLALVSFVTSHEFLPPFIIGIGSFAVVTVYLFRTSVLIFKREQWLALVPALAFLLFPKMQSAAVSGMSTMLFTALITASTYYYFARKSVVFFSLAGLALWVRPDALIFLIAALLHLAFHHGMIRRTAQPAPSGPPVAKREVLIGAVVCLVLIMAYTVFNLALSGTLFPNPIGAKLAYYHGLSGPSYTGAVSGYYLTSLSGMFFPFAIISMVVVLMDIIGRRAQPLLLPMLIVLGIVLAYGILLPFLHDDARYLVPTMPFIVLLGTAGVRSVSRWMLTLFPFASIKRALNGLSFAVFGLAILLGLTAWKKTRMEHYKAVRYVQERQVAASYWLRDHTPESAIVATHTIGAIGYYANRKMIDITGIVTPELLPTLGDLKSLEVFLKGQKTDYIATLRERFEVVNMNPLFTSDTKTPEVMEVIPYKPGQTHILVQRSSALNAQAVALMQQGMFPQAAEYLRQSYALDPMSSRTSTLTGLCMLSLKDTAQAVSFLDQSMLIQTDYAPAMTPLADIYYNRKDYKMAITLVRRALELNPGSTIARHSYDKVYKAFYADSMRTAGWRMLNVAAKQR